MLDYLTKTRRHLHQHPELSMQEIKTTAFIKAELDALDVHYDSPLAVGAVAYIRGTSDHAIAFRADIDALPLQEENEKDYKSQHDNVMHACGHDGHTAMLLGFVQKVKARADKGELKTSVYFIFQPSEETMAGAQQLLSAYTFTQQPEFIFGLHMMPDNEEGMILSKPGPITASATEYRYYIDGKPAHVANKEQGHSAGEALLMLLSQLSTLQQYHLPGLNPNIIHIGRFNAGEAINTVPMSGYLEGTIRTFSTDDLDTIKQKLLDIQTAVETVSETRIRLEFSEGYPPTVNDAKAYALMQSAAMKTSLTWHEKAHPYLFGEDFSFYGTIAPSAFAFLGCRNVEKDFCYGLHTERFDFDETVLLDGIELYEAILEEFEGKV